MYIYIYIGFRRWARHGGPLRDVLCTDRATGLHELSLSYFRLIYASRHIKMCSYKLSYLNVI